PTTTSALNNAQPSSTRAAATITIHHPSGTTTTSVGPNYYHSTSATTKSGGAGAPVKSPSLDSSATLTSLSPSSSTALQRYADPCEYPSTTICIKILLNTKASFRFIFLLFFLKQDERFRDAFCYCQHPFYGGTKNNSSYHYNLKNKNSVPPGTTPVLFMFPFPSYDEHFPITVQVTSSFDDWQRDTPLMTKNEQESRFETEILVDLEKLPEVYQRESDSNVTRSGAGAESDAAGGELNPGAKLRRKLIYKFVLDGQQWVTDAARSKAALEVAEEIMVVKETVAVAAVSQSTIRDGAIDTSSPVGELSTAANSVAGTAAAIIAETARQIRKRSLSTSMISIEAENNECERDEDYGVTILQGEPVTVSTTATTSLTFFGDHRSAAIKRSMIMTRTSADTMFHNDDLSAREAAAPFTAFSDLSDDSPAHDLPHSVAILFSNSLTFSFGSKSTHLPAMNYGDPSRDFMIQTSLPMTALSILVPRLPSMTTLAL
ncbi:hypothetical protein BG015_010528, partial [Linnemannia schmuckeri]